jgi:HAD superfamily hydrolase (TIGR01509 family)
VPGLVIFDCDGVLVDSEPISNEVLARVLSESGLPTSTDEALRTYKGLILRDVIAEAQERLGRPLPDDFVARFEAERATEFRRRLKPIAEAAETVERVRAGGLAVCVATQGKVDKTELTLGLTGLRALFDEHAVFSAYAVARGKPHPDLFLHAAATMGVPSEYCVVVEDTPIGVRAGVAAKMRVLGYAADSDAAALAEAGAEPFASLTEVPGLIGLDD